MRPKLLLHQFLLGLILVGLQPAMFVKSAAPTNPDSTKTPIQHLIVLMQENHTFDNYFGMYPGADGLPTDVKMPVDPNDPNTKYIEPFYIGDQSISDLNHSSKTFMLQYNDGKMDGFVYALNQVKQDGRISMGYYDGRDLPYYWNLADEFVLFDRFFSSAKGGSFENHFYWVSGGPPPDGNASTAQDEYSKLVTIFDRLNEKGISWKFYVQNYDPSITYRDLGNIGNRASQVVWVPLLNISRFIDDPELSKHIVDLSEYYTDLRDGTLPAVAYIAPSGASEHPPGSLQTGQRFVKTLIQNLMRSDYWQNSAFMLLYDDWGGWFDHVNPPQVDEYGYGFRVPGILVSPYARRGYIDNTQLDFTSILKFIEENWDVAPLTMRDTNANNFLEAFDFNQPPRKPYFISSTRDTSTTTSTPRTIIIYYAYGFALLIAFLVIGFAFFYRTAFKNASHNVSGPLNQG